MPNFLSSTDTAVHKCQVADTHLVFTKRYKCLPNEDTVLQLLVVTWLHTGKWMENTYANITSYGTSNAANVKTNIITLTTNNLYHKNIFISTFLRDSLEI